MSLRWHRMLAASVGCFMPRCNRRSSTGRDDCGFQRNCTNGLDLAVRWCWSGSETTWRFGARNCGSDSWGRIKRSSTGWRKRPWDTGSCQLPRAVEPLTEARPGWTSSRRALAPVSKVMDSYRGERSSSAVGHGLIDWVSENKQNPEPAPLHSRWQDANGAVACRKPAWLAQHAR